jgi:CheY-like chemotaxis protein
LKILLADDSESVRNGLADLLGLYLPEAYINKAWNGQVAIERINDPGTPFDVILTDYEMPCADGLTVVRKGRAAFPGATIIMMSGVMEDKLAGAAREAGANHCLQKPFTISSLIALLKTPVTAA